MGENELAKRNMWKLKGLLYACYVPRAFTFLIMFPPHTIMLLTNIGAEWLADLTDRGITIIERWGRAYKKLERSITHPYVSRWTGRDITPK